MKILALDASGNHCSVALCVDDQFYEKTIEAPRRQGELLLPMVADALQSMGVQGEDVDGIVFGRGPGSFTGVRLTATVAQGLAVGWGKKLLPLSNLATLAYKIYKKTADSRVIEIAIDARKQEVYAGAYQFTPKEMIIALSEQVIAQEQLSFSKLELSSSPEAIDILHFACYQLRCGMAWAAPQDIELAYLRNKVTD